ncbi:MAG TPA: hypothetical protein VF599_12910 [Pyrinomonadaceae bacterium]|jgi:hypothetical protein
MKIAAQTILLLIVCFASIEAQQQRRLPRFEDYAVREIYRGKTASVKLTSSSARMFRTMLRQNAAHGVNFAGHFILATWGCGSDCHSFAVIDAKTGRVYFSPSISFVGGQMSQDEDRLQFRKNSSLLIVAGARNDEEIGKFYYVWKNNRLRLIRKTKLPLTNAAVEN